MRRLLLVVFILGVLVPHMMAQGATVHVIQRGETLRSISAKYGVSVEALAVANNIIDPNRIFVGQRLTIPTVVTPPRTHTVRAGERLSDIATRYNTTVEALLAANNFSNPNAIFVGQILQLPPTGGPVNYSRTHVVQQGETLRIIAERYGTTWQTLAGFNNLANPNYIQIGQTLTIPPAGTVVTPPPTPTPPPASNITYVVQPGDTLGGIAVRFNVTQQSLALLNNISNPSRIFVGQFLQIPASGGPVVVAPAPTTPLRHVVQSGETLAAIGRRYNVNIYDIARANGLLNLNAIYAGQTLVIPRR